jgi:hypothetical protein
MQNEHAQHRQVPAVFLGFWALYWGLLCGLMLLLVAIGLVCLVVGLLSFFIEGWSLEMSLGGVQVRTPAQKALFASTGAGLALAGMMFWWLRARGHITAALVLFAVLMGLAYALTWVAGSSDLISIGWN